MRNSVVNCYNKALTEYSLQSDRGYSKGLFSAYRHNGCQYPRLEELKRSIDASCDDETLTVVHQFFMYPGSRFNNHSFNSYFIDKLQLNENTRYDDWSVYMKRPVNLYHGFVFRGTSTPLGVAFNEGIDCRDKSTYTEDYVRYNNNSVGVSTTKDYNTSLFYALDSRRRLSERFIYVINSANNKGYDIVQTAEARNEHYYSPLFYISDVRKKAEINIEGVIHPQDIVGAYKVDSDQSSTSGLIFIENECYVGPYFEPQVSQGDVPLIPTP